MHAFEAGSKTNQFAKPETKAVAKGIRVPHRLAGSNRPETPPEEPKGPRAGRVTARRTGRVVCRPKYQGKVFVCRFENCSLGRFLNWMMVAMPVFVQLLSEGRRRGEQSGHLSHLH